MYTSVVCQRKEIAMFCPKCGTQNADGAAFCGNCGNPLPQRAAQQNMQTAPAPMVPREGAIAGIVDGTQAVAPRPGLFSNPKILAVIVLAIAILLFLLIRAVACSGPGNPNMVDLVTKDTASVVNTVKGYKATVISGDNYFTSDDKALSEIYIASMSAHSTGKTQDDAIKTLQKHDGIWFFQLCYNSDDLDLAGLNNSNPTRTKCYTLVSKDKLTSKEASEILAKVAPFDRCVFYSYSGDYPSVSGMAKGNGCVSEFEASALKDSNGNVKVWTITITTYSISEDRNGASESSDFDSSYEKFNASNYSDSYKK